MMGLVWAVIGRRADDRHRNRLVRLAAALCVWRNRSRARRALAGVDLRIMSDAGIDPLAARYEAARRFRIAERRLS